MPLGPELVGSILGGLDPLSLAKDLAKAFFSTTLSLFGTAASDLVSALLGFIAKTSEPVFSSGWWAGPGQAVFDRVLLASGSLLALAFMVSIITAVVSADHGLLARAARRLPVAVIEMGLLVAVTAALISASDEISSSIAAGSTGALSSFATADLATAISLSGIVGLIAGGLVVLAGIVIWLELICRTALIYVAVMAGPLIFAASVHPSVSGLKRRYVESGLALIFSKVVVALALATGSAMLGGLSSSPSFSAAVGELLEALAVLLVACFAPFVLLRLLVGAEAIIATEGLERRPARAALGVASVATSAAGFSAMVRGLGASSFLGGTKGDSRGASGSGGAPPPSPAPPSGGSPHGGPPRGGPRPPGSSPAGGSATARPNRTAAAPAQGPSASGAGATTTRRSAPSGPPAPGDPQAPPRPSSRPATSATAAPRTSGRAR